MNTKARSTAVRTAPWLSPRLWLALGVLAVAAGIAAARPAAAQEAQEVQIASADQLAGLVGPIALYPDDLVAIVLPAATYPLQVVQAARFLEDRKRDSSLQPDEEWDDSIVALLNYPEVVALLNDDLDWTYDLGTAVLNQRADVLNAIQTFRGEAYAAGNLRTDDRQTVARDDGELVIKPANPQVIYVPYYEPERVVIYQTVPVYHYYPRRYPVYYYPYPASYVFDTGYFWGVRSWFSIGWHSHLVHVYDPFYASHPYYGWSYYDPWYPRNVFVNINVNRNRDYVWEPRQRYGGRPVVRGYEGRVYSGNTQPPRSGGGTAGGAYRGRSTEGTSQTGDARQPRRGVLADSSRGTATAPATGSSTYRGGTAVQRAPSNVTRAPADVTRSNGAQTAPRASGSNAVPERTYRSGGGMSQALERQRSQPQPSQSQAPSQVYRSAPQQRERATQPSTGMPRESSRSSEAQASEPRAAPQVSREQSGGGMSQAQRGGGNEGGGGSYRGGGNEGGGGSSRGGGNSDGGGREHPAARSSEGRSAGR